MRGFFLLILYALQDQLGMWGILQMEYTKKKTRLAAAGIIFFVLLLTEHLWKLEENGILLWIPAECVLVLLLFEGKGIDNIVKFFCMFFWMDMIEAPITVLLSVIKRHSFEKLEGIGLEGDILLSICMLFMVFKTKNHTHWEKILHNFSTRHYITGIFIGFCSSVIGGGMGKVAEYIPVVAADFLEIICLLMKMCLYGLTLKFLFTDEARKQKSWELYQNQLVLDHEQQNNERMRRYVEDVQKIKHDMKYQMDAAYHYFSEEKSEKAREHLEQMQGRLHNIEAYDLDVGNDLINAILWKEEMGSDYEIKIKCDGVLPEHIAMDDYDLCSVFSNLLSNAVEACAKLKQKEKVITLYMRQYHSHWMLEISNTIEWDVDVEHLGEYSSKEDNRNHGWGLQNVKEAVERNGGAISFSVKGQMFTVSILF